MENKKTNKGLLWIIIAVATIAVAAVVVGIFYFMPEKEAEPNAYEKVATQFVEAYRNRDKITQFDLLIYDARTQWEDKLIAEHGSEEAFCKLVQEQADRQGIEFTINSFDDYLRDYHKQDLIYKQESYGEYTLTTAVAGSEKLSSSEAFDPITNTAGAVGAPYFADGLANTIHEVYRVTVDMTIDGTIKDLSEQYQVYMVNHDGQWKVLSYTT